MKNKTVAILLAAMVGATALAGCASYEQQGAIVEAAGSASSDAKLTIAEDETEEEASEEDIAEEAIEEIEEALEAEESAETAEAEADEEESADEKADEKEAKEKDADEKEASDEEAADEKAVDDKKEDAKEEASEDKKDEADEEVATKHGGNIVVTGSASVTAVPDMAEIIFGVRTDNEDAKEAQSENTKDVNAIMKALADLEIDESSIKTIDYAMYPQYNYEDNSVYGYEVITTISVTDQKIADAGEIVEAVVDAGANNISGVNYSCSEYDDLYEEALAQAVAAAKKKATVLATAADGEIECVVNITEGYQDISGRYQDLSYAATAKESADETTLMPGEIDITANVTVTYELK